MAKRIITNGKYNVVTCDDCGCVFAFDKADLEPDGKTIACPQCGAIKEAPSKETK